MITLIAMTRIQSGPNALFVLSDFAFTMSSLFVIRMTWLKQGPMVAYCDAGSTILRSISGERSGDAIEPRLVHD